MNTLILLLSATLTGCHRQRRSLLRRIVLCRSGAVYHRFDMLLCSMTGCGVHRSCFASCSIIASHSYGNNPGLDAMMQTTAVLKQLVGLES